MDYQYNVHDYTIMAFIKLIIQYNVHDCTVTAMAISYNWLFLWDEIHSINGVLLALLTPICSMFGIFTNMYHINDPNVGKYSIHGASGTGISGDKLVYKPI